MSVTNCQKCSYSAGDRSNVRTQSPRVLCCFSDQDKARGYEQALINSGFSLLRARHGMHAYWLAIAAKPAVLVIDARDTDIANDYLLGRLQRNNKLARTPMLVITHQEIATDPDVAAPLSLIDGDIVPSMLAARVSDIVAELKHIQQQNVDAFFSDLQDDAQDISSAPPHAIRRADSPQQSAASRLPQETQRWRSKVMSR